MALIDLRADSKLKDGLASGHIARAILLPWSKLTTIRVINGIPVRAMSLDGPAFAALMSDLGIRNKQGVVITTPGLKQTQIIRATRLYWTMKLHNHNQVALLDGGNALWSHQGRPLTKNIDLKTTIKTVYQHNKQNHSRQPESGAGEGKQTLSFGCSRGRLL